MWWGGSNMTNSMSQQGSWMCISCPFFSAPPNMLACPPGPCPSWPQEDYCIFNLYMQVSRAETTACVLYVLLFGWLFLEQGTYPKVPSHLSHNNPWQSEQDCHAWLGHFSMLEDESWIKWGSINEGKGEMPGGLWRVSDTLASSHMVNFKMALPDMLTESSHALMASYLTNTVLGTVKAINSTWPQPCVLFQISLIL